MRVLVVGAGAIGGYFGGRLAEAGREVTFLVRPRRAEQLSKRGLEVRSPHGDIHIAKPATVLAQDLAEPFDLVILSCKAYDLDDAIESFAPAVGRGTAILPLLNGMSHLDTLERRFGSEHVLGGQCVIGATLDDEGRILHLNETHGLTYGERDGAMSERVERIARVFESARFQARSSDAILLEMWEKWVFLASLASGTCLMRAAVGDIVAAPGGAEFLLGLFDECRTIAEGEGYVPRAPFLERSRKMLTTAGSPFTASMLRDIERGARIEADHVIGDLIRRGRERAGTPRPKLETAYVNLKAYEARRERRG
jgi:2-dehydropantoate 2-reductase